MKEHITRIPADLFIRKYLSDPNVNIMRLFGEMHAINFVIVVTQDFEAIHYRIRPTLVSNRMKAGNWSFCCNILSRITRLKEELTAHYQDKEFLACKTMGEVVQHSLRLVLKEAEHPH